MYYEHLRNVSFANKELININVVNEFSGISMIKAT